MSDQRRLINSTPNTPGERYQSKGFAESDTDFLERQFQMSIEALERVQALSPGEFDSLVQTPARTEEERNARSAHHIDIARRALIAAQQGLLAEEEFNIWSGRRKEAGQPVKYRFERAYANACTSLVSCKRGALTGIVRSYLRLQDEIIAELISRADTAKTADELLEVEKDALRTGFLEFELYTNGVVSGWPCFPRSTGRFRGATRLRQYFEQRQEQLPLSSASAERLREQILDETLLAVPKQMPPPHVAREPHASYRTDESAREFRVEEKKPAPFQRLITLLARLFE